MNDDSRMAIYISVMVMVLSCVVLGYGLVFFGWGPKINLNRVSILPESIVVAGLIIATINGIAGNVLSDQLGKKLDTLSPTLKFGIPITAFLSTLALSIFIALLSI